MIRFGIVGFGLHAEKRLVPGFELAERCVATALSRRDPEKAERSAAGFGIPLAFTSTEELCGSDEVDAVFVTSPDSLHMPDVLTAVRFQKPVLCEKPLAMNGEEASSMVDAAREAGVPLGVAQVFRFEESTRRFRERIEAGDIGTPILARAEFLYPGLESPRRWITNPGLACGGPIADVGVHCVDVLRFILQDEVVRVGTQAVGDEQSGPFESSAVLSLDFESGVLATVVVSTRSEYRTLLEVSGTGGSLIAHDGLNVEHPLTIEFRTGPHSGVQETEGVSNHLAYAHQVDAFAAAIEEGSEFEVPGEEGLRNQLILDAAFRSRETGRVETVAQP